MWTARFIGFALLIIFFLSPVYGDDYSEIADCVMLIGAGNIKKPSISHRACRDTEEGFCFATFPLDAATIGNNLNE